MKQELQIFCKNNNIIRKFPIGSTLLDIYRGYNLDIPYGPLCARVNNKTESLNYQAFRSKDVEFINIQDPSGMRTYVRSVCFVLYKAVKDLYPEGTLLFEHAISKGYFCKLHIHQPITEEVIDKLRDRMQEIITADIPYEESECRTKEAVKLFKEHNMPDKVKLLESSGMLYSKFYKLADTIDYYYSCLLPSTGYIKIFDIETYYDGILLRIPQKDSPLELEPMVEQEKMYAVFKEHLKWLDIMGMSNVGDLNNVCLDGKATDIIKVAEALQEKKISRIADHIHDEMANGRQIKMILISGPSSSGKTTFSKRLAVQLMANGIKPFPIELDNYFVNRVDTPKDENGEYDYETITAIDLPYFNQQLQEVLDGQEVEIPRYNFITGKREESGVKIKLQENSILILEGIHALNPDLTPHISDDKKFKIYVSTLTDISLDDHNWISTTDNRLLRRIIRDYNYRGYSAQETISRWPSVEKGERKWIFPFQENADVMFNSSLLYEFAVLRPYVEPVLRTVPNNLPEYSEAHRLLKFIHYFVTIKVNEIPPTSLLREFLGGSSFRY
ncbi:MAG: nucleoside kinase [Bacteroidaceae bacterium]|nr:nucleoside kinase [Bacteroidaceae bacterium]